MWDVSQRRLHRLEAAWVPKHLWIYGRKLLSLASF